MEREASVSAVLVVATPPELGADSEGEMVSNMAIHARSSSLASGCKSTFLYSLAPRAVSPFAVFVLEKFCVPRPLFPDGGKARL